MSVNMMKRQLLRVKQIADQTFQRGEKTELLNDELSAADKRVDFIKQSCQNNGKKLSLCTQRLASDNATSDRRSSKKVPEAALAQCMEEWGLYLGESSLLGITMVDCARIQEALASDLLAYKANVEASVVEPLQNILKVDVANVAKCRKQLTKLTSELDATKLRHQTALKSCQQVSNNNLAAAIAKADSLKEETEDAATKVDQCRDMLTAEMFSLISREPELSNLYIKLCHLQLEYHRSAMSVLESTLPDLEAQINSYPYHPVFGQSLEDHLRYTNREIALVLETCVCWLLEKAINEEGLFRIGGSITKIKKIKSAFDAGVSHLIEDERDPHNIAGVLKLYLRNLPEPLLTYDLYDEWINAARIKDHGSQMQALWKVVNCLPEANFKNLKYLCKFLSKLCKNSETNKMSSQNLAIVIGPNLLWSPVQESALGMNMTATNLHSSIVDILITYADWFFPEDCEFYLSTPTSPRHLNGMPSSLRSSELSLSTTKLSNGDSAVDSLSSSPTNSPKSPSPRVITRTKKKTAPLAPNYAELSRNLITRSMSCNLFQPNNKDDDETLRRKTLTQLSVSHEDLSPISKEDHHVLPLSEDQQNGTSKIHKSESAYYHSVPVIKPGRTKGRGLPPLMERSHKPQIERPTVPPPERPTKRSSTNSSDIQNSPQKIESEAIIESDECLENAEDKKLENTSSSYMDDSDFDEKSSMSPDLEESSLSPSEHSDINGCGTPNWFDHYSTDRKDSNTMWFDMSSQNLQEDLLDDRTEKDDVFIKPDCPDDSTDVNPDEQYCTIIPVGDEDDYKPLYKFSPPQNTTIKLRVNSHNMDTRL